MADGQAALTGEMRHEGSWQNMMSAQTLLEARDAKPDACTDTFTMIHSVLDEVVMREQAGMRSLLSKLLAVVVWVMLLVCVVCRILSRRYGCRMIYHWENIYYIHQMCIRDSVQSVPRGQRHTATAAVSMTSAKRPEFRKR